MHYLTNNERLCIEKKRRQTRHKKEHIRLSVLIMLAEGFQHEVIALSQGIDADTISNWKRKHLIRLYTTFEEYKKAILDLFARLPDYQQELKSLLTLKFQILNSALLAKHASG